MFVKTAFSEFIDEQIIDGEHVLIIDAHNMIYRTLHIANANAPEDNEKFWQWRHLFVNALIAAIRQFEPNKVVVAIDSKNSWRKEIYSEYKVNRKATRDKSTIDYAKFYPVCDELIWAIRCNFKNIYFLRIDRTEADDIVAVLCKERFNNTGRVTILSTDTDYVQLLTESNIKLFSPLTNQYTTSINPAKDLQVKFLKGDVSDNIPPVKRGVGPKTALKILDSTLDAYINECVDIKGIKLEDDRKKRIEEIHSNYERNKKLIDFKHIPDDIKEGILKEYDNYKIEEYDGKGLWSFCMKNKLAKIADGLNTHALFLRKLK